MNGDTAARVNYFDKQFLRVDEFRDEQLYQLALRRRHNNTQHTWGIISGLEIADEEGAIVVQPGLAIDGYGRELLLTAKKGVEPESFDDLGTDRLDLWLVYGRKDDGNIPVGYGECGSSGEGKSYRSTETPDVLVERALTNRVEARQPPGVPRDTIEALVPPLSDDPDDLWRVYLGRVIRLEDGKLFIDLTRRPYVGVVAESIDHPANAARVEIGRESAEEHERTVGDVTYVYKKAENGVRRFGVFVAEDLVPTPDQKVELAPRIDIVDEVIGLRGRTAVHGHMQLSGGAVQFVHGAHFTAEDAPQSPSIYRYTEGSEDELRIDLGSDETGNRKFVIGFSSPDGKFTPCVTMELALNEEGDLAPIVTIWGDLKVEGKIVGEILPVMIGPEAMAAIRVAFEAGLNAGNNPS